MKQRERPIQQGVIVLISPSASGLPPREESSFPLLSLSPLPSHQTFTVFFWGPESTMLPQISYTRGYLTGRALLHGKQKQKPYPLSTFGLSVYYSILNFRVKTFYFCFFLTFIKKQKQKQNKTSNQPTEKSTMFWL